MAGLFSSAAPRSLLTPSSFSPSTFFVLPSPIFFVFLIALRPLHRPTSQLPLFFPLYVLISDNMEFPTRNILDDDSESLFGDGELLDALLEDVTDSLSETGKNPLVGNGENNPFANINKDSLFGGDEDHGSLSANGKEDSLFGDEDSLFGDDEDFGSPHEAKAPTIVDPVAPAPALPAFPRPTQIPALPTIPWTFPTVPSASSARSFVAAAPAEAYGAIATPAAPSVTPSPEPSFVAAPAGAYGPIPAVAPASPVVAAPATPVAAAPTSPDENEAPLASSANNDAGVIGVDRIPGFQYRAAVTQQRIRLLSTIGAIEADGADIAEYLAPFLTLSIKHKFEALSEALEIDEGTRKKALTPAIKQWLTASEEHRGLLGHTAADTTPFNPNRLDTKINLLAASVGMLRDNHGVAWFGGETRTLVWPRDSTVICFHFARLLYRLLVSHRQVEKNNIRKHPEVPPPAPVSAPAQAASAPVQMSAHAAPGTPGSPIDVEAFCFAPPKSGGEESPIVLDPPTPVTPAVHNSSEDITPEPARRTPPELSNKKRKQPDWLKGSVDHHVLGSFGLGKRVRRG